MCRPNNSLIENKFNDLKTYFLSFKKKENKVRNKNHSTRISIPSKPIDFKECLENPQIKKRIEFKPV